MPKYRSKFEARLAPTIPVGFEYESIKLDYTISHRYTPDWYNETTKEILEAKGIWDDADRAKMLAIKAAYPHIRITMLFQNASLPITKGSKTTYSAWCDKHGIQWRQA